MLRYLGVSIPVVAQGLDGYQDQVREINEIQGQLMKDLNRQVREAKWAAK